MQAVDSVILSPDPGCGVLLQCCRTLPSGEGVSLCSSEATPSSKVSNWFVFFFKWAFQFFEAGLCVHRSPWAQQRMKPWLSCWWCKDSMQLTSTSVVPLTPPGFWVVGPENTRWSTSWSFLFLQVSQILTPHTPSYGARWGFSYMWYFPLVCFDEKKRCIMVKKIK